MLRSLLYELLIYWQCYNSYWNILFKYSALQSSHIWSELTTWLPAAKTTFMMLHYPQHSLWIPSVMKHCTYTESMACSKTRGNLISTNMLFPQLQEQGPCSSTQTFMKHRVGCFYSPFNKNNSSLCLSHFNFAPIMVNGYYAQISHVSKWKIHLKHTMANDCVIWMYAQKFKYK